MKKIYHSVLWFVLCTSIGFAATDGAATFSVTTSSTGDQYETRHIIAVWVTDSSGNFVKTLMEFSGTRRTYLNVWQADTTAAGVAYDTTGVPDALSGATINGHRTHTMTWDCRNRSGVIVPDGTYTIKVEMTAKNGSGPIKIFTFNKGPNPVSLNPSSFTYNSRTVFSGMSLVYTPAEIPHNIGVSKPPSSLFIGSSTPVTVTVSNLTSTTENNIKVVLQNDTTGLPIQTNTISLLEGFSTQEVNFTWDTTGFAPGNIQTLRVTAGPVPEENSTADNSRAASALFKTPVHDLSVGLISAPAFLTPDSSGTITISVTNTGAYTESFSVRLEDLTDQTVDGSNVVSSLASGASTSVSFIWSTAGKSKQYHLLRAVAGPVTGETSIQDNVQEISLVVADGTQSAMVILPGSIWKYQDEGLNLHQSTWNKTTYYDDWWASGPGPLGYGNAGLNTIVSYGPDDQTKYPCTYFRKTVILPYAPVIGQIYVQRDDGVVVYINGHEVVRDNMPAGTITYQTLATDFVDGADETAYRSYAIPANIMQAGLNIIAAEVHQADMSSSDLQFDLRLVLSLPTFPEVNDLAITQISAPASILAGDQVDIAVRAANLGSKTEVAQITLSDDVSGTIGAVSINELIPGATETVTIPWNTLDAATGSHRLSAEVTTLAGETNVSNNILSTPVQISSDGWTVTNPGTDGGIGGFCSAVTVSGPLAVIGEGSTLTTLDISKPESPQRLGSLLLNGRIEDLSLVASIAIAACGSQGIQFFDLSDTSAPVYMKTFDSSGHAWKTVPSGDRLYAADGVSGLKIFDITNPASPALIGGYATEGAARSVVLNANTAYLLDSRNGLLILDVSDSTSPQLLGQYDGISGGTDLALFQSYIYIIDDLARLTAIDISNPTAPALQTQLDLPGPGTSLSFYFPYLVIAIENKGIQNADISTPSAPIMWGFEPSAGQALDVSLSSDFVCYLADGEAGLSVMLAAEGSYAESSRARQSAEQDNLLYIAAGTSGVKIYNVTNPAAPSLEGIFATPSNACGVAVSPHALYVADGQYGLLLGDLTVPEFPVAKGRFSSPILGTIHSVACSGDRAVITDGSKVALINASNLAAPFGTALYETTGAYLYDVDMTSNLVAVAAGSDGALLLDPGSLALLGSVPADEAVTDVAIDGTNLWLSAGEQWIAADVSVPGFPVILATHNGAPSRVLTAVSGMVAVQQSPALTVFDTTTPLTPVDLNTLPALVDAMSLAISGNYVLASLDDAGLAIQMITGMDLDDDGLPDSWEQTIIDALPDDDITSLKDVLPNHDFDGDGLSNLAEWIAGTSPIDASSVFAMISMKPVPGGFPVRWHSVPGKTYTIHVSTNLTEGFTELPGKVTATGPVTEQIISDAEPQSYFMVTVE